MRTPGRSERPSGGGAARCRCHREPSARRTVLRVTADGETRRDQKEEGVQDDAGHERDTGLTRAEWLLLLVLAAVQFTHSMDFMVMMPLGPQCRQELGISPREFALVVGSYGFIAAPDGLLAARVIIRFDRKSALFLL